MEPADAAARVETDGLWGHAELDKLGLTTRQNSPITARRRRKADYVGPTRRLKIPGGGIEECITFVSEVLGEGIDKLIGSRSS